MVKQVVLRQTGTSLVVRLPTEVADRLQLWAGDRMYVIETGDGILLTPYDPQFHDAVMAFGEVRRQYRNTLKKLAD
jgi:putative addiction module antidote